jgi:tetratricopeptide (TPR) repeat protein
MKSPRLPRILPTGIATLAIATSTLAQAPKTAPPAPPKKTASTVPITVQKFEAAEQLFKDDKIPEALAAFQKLRADKDFKISTLLPQVYAYEGWCYFVQKQYKNALGSFDNLIKEYPDSPFAAEANLKRAECYRELKDYPQALKIYEDFLRKYPRDPKIVRPEDDLYRNLRAQALLGQGWTIAKLESTKDKQNLAPVKAIIQRLLAEHSDDPIIRLNALFLQGLVLNQEKDFDGARAVYSEIAKMRNDPNAATAIFLAAESMWDAKKYEDAISFYKSIPSKPAVVAAARRQLADLDARKADWFRRYNSFEQFNAQRAVLESVLKRFESGDDQRPVALLRIGNCYQQLGKPEEASVVYQFILDMYPLEKLSKNEKPIHENAHYRLIQTLNERKQPLKADEMAALFKQKFPDTDLNADANFTQAEAKFGTRDFKGALPLYQESLTKVKDAQVLEVVDFRIPSCYFELEDFEQAVKGYDTFRTKHPNSKYAPTALFLIGRARFMIARNSSDQATAKKNLADAVTAFEDVRKNYPTFDNLPILTFQLGYLYSFLGAYDIDPKTGKPASPANYDKAIAAYQEFLEKWPETKNADEQLLAPEAWFQIAQAQAALQKPTEAIKAYQTLIEKYPNSVLAPEAAYNIGGAYYSLQKTPDMIAALRAYTEKYPNHDRVADAIFIVAQHYESEKKFDDAIAQYRNLIAKAATRTDNEKLVAAAIGAQTRVATMLEAKDPKAAIKECETFLGQFKDNPVAARATITNLRDIYRRAKLTNEAYTHLEQLVSQYNQNAPVRLAGNTAIIELALGEKDYRRASTVVLKLIADPQKDNLPPLSYAAIGNTYLRTDKYQDAITYFDKMSAAGKDDPRMQSIAQLGLAQSYLQLNQFDKAGPLFEKLMQDPNSPSPTDVKFGSAKVLENTGQIKKAILLYDQVMAAKGASRDQQYEAAFRIGNIYFNNLIEPEKGKDNKKVALVYYFRIISGPLADEAAFRAAQCHQALGNVEAARTGFKMYIARFKDGKFVKEATDALAKLPPPAGPTKP